MDNEKTICITLDRYNELLRAETWAGILRYAYRTMDRYDEEKVMDAVFGVENKYKGDGSHA